MEWISLVPRLLGEEPGYEARNEWEWKDENENERMRMGMKGWEWEWKDESGNERMSMGMKGWEWEWGREWSQVKQVMVIESGMENKVMGEDVRMEG